ncbi:Ig-specific serine endopeptidase MIP [Ureaplasma diversum]|uniref:DUF31 domain-containing protein n=1 Tax=Ureaplasma diversum NCTC 246 TaxID=1188241 RepID=A0A084F1K7_9BACT|nr:DUF31 family protein [Ureaplasma diversum]KEZ24099.1 Hypothetical protein, predicted lipoprotein [Ureaplasma diversum NCTC 246]
MKKVINKKWLGLIVGSVFVLSATAAVAASCNNEKKDDNPQLNQQSQTNSVTTPLLDPKDTSKEGYKPSNEDLAKISKAANDLNVTFTQLANRPNLKSSDIMFDQIEQESIKFEIKGNYANEFEGKVANIAPDLDEHNNNVSFRTGKAKIILELKHIPTSTSVTKTVLIDDLKSNPANANSKGQIQHIARAPSKSEVNNYLTTYTQLERFEKDNNPYVESLRRYRATSQGLPADAPLSDVIKNVKVTENQKAEFDKKAKALNLDTYDNQAVKAWTIPSYDETGKVTGLNIQDNPGQQASWVDYYNRLAYRSSGLARTLTNQTYKDIALQTYIIKFTNQDPEHPHDELKSVINGGTAWILDYEKPTNGSKYPTKWYLATNIHVANDLTDETKNLSLTRINNDVGIGKTLRIDGLDDNFSTFIFDMKKMKKKPKVVYKAVDFLNKDPSDYLVEEQKQKYKDYKEYADFAVIEIDLSGVEENALDYGRNPLSNFPREDLKDGEKFARHMTDGYAEKSEEKKIKFLKESYLKNYKKIDVPLADLSKDANKDKYDFLYALGYPSSVGDYFLKQYVDDDQKLVAKWHRSLWINQNEKFYEKISVNELTNESTFSKEELERGNIMSYQIGLRTFIDKPGLSDAFIGVPFITKEPLETKVTDDQNKEKSVKLIQMGLQYLPRHYEPTGGASGSSIRNQKNELVSIFHSSFLNTITGLSAAFRSEGFNYNGLYGDYNLPQYDLIYGGGQDQKKDKYGSFKDALKAMYPNSNMKTALFPEGVDHEYQEFKFTELAKPSSSSSSSSSSSNN